MPRRKFMHCCGVLLLSRTIEGKLNYIELCLPTSNDILRTTKATGDMKTVLETLQDQLIKKNFLVGEQLTLADIIVVSTLVYPFKLVCDEKFLEPYNNVVRWFSSCVQRPEFMAVLGSVEICKEAVKPVSESGS